MKNKHKLNIDRLYKKKTTHHGNSWMNAYMWGILALVSIIISSCSSTSNLPEGEQLYTGLKKIQFSNYERCSHADSTITEIEAALDYKPNGSLFGSSYYTTPIPVRLWIWNAFAKSEDGLGKWFRNTFGSEWRLISKASPDMRAQIAQGQLKKYGYFRGKVSYDIITKKNKKKAKIAYKVDMGPLWRIDSVEVTGLPDQADSIIMSHKAESYLHPGVPFDVPMLNSERQRIGRLLRNNGYYYFQDGYLNYLADTLRTPQKAKIEVSTAQNLPDSVLHPYYLNNVELSMMNGFDRPTDSITFRKFKIKFSEKKPPLRPGLIIKQLSLRPGQIYNQENEQESYSRLHASDMFQLINFSYEPNTPDGSDSLLNLKLDCILQKPYEFYVEATGKGKTSGWMGPEMTVGITRRNLLKSGEKLDISLYGNYEWQTGHHNEGSSSRLNSYEYGATAKLVFPTIMTPWKFARQLMGIKRKRNYKPRRGGLPAFFDSPTTTIAMSFATLNRADYFKRHVVSGELTYDWHSSAQWHHTFSPLTLSYEYMNSRTAAFDSLLRDNAYLQVSMRDQFIPKMSYTFEYSSPTSSLHPVKWSTTVSEASNLIALGYMAGGKHWSEKEKTMFKNPFAQFVKIETNIVKSWQLTPYSSVAARFSGGVVWSYGNSSSAPYTELFYVGGANSIRAFNVRSIGPGKYMPSAGRFSYIDQTGDIKLLGNVEWRPRLFGNLSGAVFLDAGNVWTIHDDPSRPGGQFEFSKFFRQIAVGSGVGLRYDMGVAVIRVDWGVGLHVPYDTFKNGFFNIDSFHDAQTLHFAIGLPF